VYTGESDNPGSFIPFFSSLPVMSEVQHFTVVTESNQPARIARFVISLSSVTFTFTMKRFIKITWKTTIQFIKIHKKIHSLPER
jgi:hypothetical protein